MIQLLTRIFLWHAALLNPKKIYIMVWYRLTYFLTLPFFSDYLPKKLWFNHSFILVSN